MYFRVFPRIHSPKLYRLLFKQVHDVNISVLVPSKWRDSNPRYREPKSRALAKLDYTSIYVTVECAVSITRIPTGFQQLVLSLKN